MRYKAVNLCNLASSFTKLQERDSIGTVNLKMSICFAVMKNICSFKWMEICSMLVQHAVEIVIRYVYDKD